MPARLTAKQEAFAVAYVKTGNASEAYRQSYDASRTKPDVVHVKASQLLADGRVAVRVKELQAKVADKAQITLESHLRDLMMLRNMAVKEKQISAAIAAEVARGKHSGVAVVRSETTVNLHADDDDARAAALAERLERGETGATRH
jgi:phage terminase small subunit